MFLYTKKLCFAMEFAKVQKIHWNENSIYWTPITRWSSTHCSYKANLNIFPFTLIIVPSLRVGNIWLVNPTSFVFSKFASLGLSSLHISQKLWSIQHVIVTLFFYQLWNWNASKSTIGFLMNQKHFLSQLCICSCYNHILFCWHLHNFYFSFFL